jgi:hypothetical protein
MSNLTNQNPSQPQNISPIELFTMMRTYVQHEDALINYRLSWMLVVQSLLFTGYGLSVQKLTELSDPNKHFNLDHLQSFLTCLTFLGLLTSTLTGISIYGAVSSISRIIKHWKEYCKRCKENSYETSKIRNLPALTGGSPLTRSSGIAAAYGFPVIFFATWVILCKSLYIGAFSAILLLLTAGLIYLEEQKAKEAP